MSRIFAPHRPKVKPARRTARVHSVFGCGLLSHVPEITPADARLAVAAFEAQRAAESGLEFPREKTAADYRRDLADAAEHFASHPAPDPTPAEARREAEKAEWQGARRWRRFEPSPDEERWAAQFFADARAAEQEREMDATARDRELEDAYLASVGAGAVCSLCGLRTDALENGTCATCAKVLDRDGEVGGDGGTCGRCGRPCDFLESDGMCCPCSLAVADMSESGNRGY